MSNDDMSNRKGPAKRDQGPQGTQVFSRDEVDRLLDEATTSAESSRRAHLQGSSGEYAGKAIALASARVVIGRASSCDLLLNDPSVSSEHARIVHDSTGWRIVNLLSTNGTFVNDKRISNAELHDGDRVRIGRVDFVFRDPDEDRTSSDESGDGDLSQWLPWVAGAVAIVVAGALLFWLL